MNRVTAFLIDVAQVWREEGFCASSRLVWSRIFARYETLLYELRTTSLELGLPADWQVTVLRSEKDPAAVDLLRRVGGEAELRNFRRKAVAYVLSIEDEPVARCWYFPNSSLARRLGPDAAYFGMRFVRPEWRGQGIQARLMTYTASLLPIGTRVIVEILPSNVASQNGVAKAGSVYVGRLHTIVLLGRVIRARIEASPHPDATSSPLPGQG